MKISMTIRHLIQYVLACIVSEAIILALSGKEWWHWGLVLPPLMFLVMGGIFVMLMRRTGTRKMVGLLIAKALKLLVVALVLVLFIVNADAQKMQNVAFVMVTFLSYLINLGVSTYVYVAWQKNKTQE